MSEESYLYFPEDPMNERAYYYHMSNRSHYRHVEAIMEKYKDLSDGAFFGVLAEHGICSGVLSDLADYHTQGLQELEASCSYEEFCRKRLKTLEEEKNARGEEE